MHHYETLGWQFNFNGDYSGDIKVIDPYGFDWPPMPFEQILYIIADTNAQNFDHITPFRRFVAEAVRKSAIIEWESMDTEDILKTPLGKSVLEDGYREYELTFETTPDTINTVGSQ